MVEPFWSRVNREWGVGDSIDVTKDGDLAVD
jgi:hypothetical protein